MSNPPGGRRGTPPGLGPHLVGQRVVVRRVVRGETGPTGGPALTDLLGVMESWGEGVTTVRAESGEVTAIQVADIVSGKPVPPRPSVRHRVSAEEAERRALASWPALDTEPLGDWLLRASGGFSARANSVLAVGHPGLPLAPALDAVRSFYARHDLPAWAQVVVGSDVHLAVESAGWGPARPGEDDTAFQIASVARALRGARRSLPSVVPPVSSGTTVSAAWLADDQRALSHREAAVGVLEGPGEVLFVSVEEPGDRPESEKDLAEDEAGHRPAGGVVAKGRAAYADDWLGITDVWVSPQHRRSGLATVVMAALLDWGAERGATTAYLQTRGDNPAALALYERLGFLTHHTYRYLAAPA